MDNASTNPLTDFWLSLPEELKARLRLGFTGKMHLLDMAGWCLRSGNPALVPIATDALQAALGENPLDGEMAVELLSLDVVRSILPQETLAALTALAANWHRPDNNGYFEKLCAGRDFFKMKQFVEQAVAREPDNLFWREQGVSMGLVDNDPDWVVSIMDFDAPLGIEPLMSNVMARIRLFCGQWHDSARLSQHMGQTFGPAFAALRGGFCMLNEGDAAAANLLLLKGLSKTPWNTSLLMRVHDLLTGVDKEQVPLPGSTAILLYSWNKGLELDATLRSLMASDLSGVSLFVLDNGSTDNTAEILESWQSRFESVLGSDRFTTISLPVNIGAPAARNWLMHLEAVRHHDFICYLDDDVELPADWLLKLGAAERQYPEAGVWGCKVVDHANASLVQSADSHLSVDKNAPPMDLTRTAPNPFKLTDLHIQSLDSGLFDILRPCASVTGCCHLFRTAILLESGDFAIHLSPSQYDDMEHDLRLCEAGLFPVYQGHLTVHHKKRTGAASRVSMQEEGNALGNKYKMQTMHEHEGLVAAMTSEQKLLEDDLLRKIKVVESVLVG
ncbi:MAG: glycosyltransferase family 2 protein [Pseudodesulfovibrio sp.]|nr:glycosyltransferase family 2 protein [Pseudodesulfovibrio sp.]